MKVPKTFIPEKDLTERVNNYLSNDKHLRKKGYLHRDPNLNVVISTLGVILRLEGKNHRTIDQYLNKFLNQSEEDGCVYVIDFFKTAEVDLPVNVRQALLEHHLKKDYTQKIKLDIINSYLDEKPVIQNGVMDYVNMAIGIDATNLGPNKTWMYRDPKTGIPKTIKIDTKYMHEVEKKLGLTRANVEIFRQGIRKIYGTRIMTDPCYDFMDNRELVEAVTNVKLESEINKSGSLVSILANNTDEENKQVYKKVTNNMIKHHGYCKVCAEKTLEYFCASRE